MTSQQAGTIDVGAVFERVLRTYAEHWRVLILGALILFAPIALLGGIVAASDSAGLAIVLMGLIVLGSIWYQGMVVETVRDVQDGRLDSSVGQLFASVTPVLGTLLGAGLLAVAGVLVGFLLLIVPGLYLLTIWAVLAPAIVIERVGVGAAFGRSRELVRGNGWQVFGVIVAVFAIQFMLSVVLSAIGAIGDSVAWNVLLQLVQSLIVAPIWALAASILYFALREAHGDSALAQPTGVLRGGFVPPVPPMSRSPRSRRPPNLRRPPGRRWGPTKMRRSSRSLPRPSSRTRRRAPTTVRAPWTRSARPPTSRSVIPSGSRRATPRRSRSRRSPSRSRRPSSRLSPVRAFRRRAGRSPTSSPARVSLGGAPVATGPTPRAAPRLRRSREPATPSARSSPVPRAARSSARGGSSAGTPERVPAGSG